MADQRKFFLKEKKILIYGAGSLGMRCNGILKTAGIDGQILSRSVLDGKSFV